MNTLASAMLVVAGSCLAVGSGDAVAALQMYKCIVGGRTVYQQAACAADAEPASAAAITARASPANAPGKAASGSGHAASANTTRLRPATEPASSVPARPQ